MAHIIKIDLNHEQTNHMNGGSIKLELLKKEWKKKIIRNVILIYYLQVGIWIVGNM